MCSGRSQENDFRKPRPTMIGRGVLVGSQENDFRKPRPTQEVRKMSHTSGRSGEAQKIDFEKYQEVRKLTPDREDRWKHEEVKKLTPDREDRWKHEEVRKLTPNREDQWKREVRKLTSKNIRNQKIDFEKYQEVKKLTPDREDRQKIDFEKYEEVRKLTLDRKDRWKHEEVRKMNPASGRSGEVCSGRSQENDFRNPANDSYLKLLGRSQKNGFRFSFVSVFCRLTTLREGLCEKLVDRRRSRRNDQPLERTSLNVLS
ncbi:hypothetical protein V8G54_012810 [Vigna mungo]|uniref:Uncharacterized protein n=1 Tax=Vigna mungo TaxID=3915 RepID=A0AAQ3S4D2_VIGMU